MAELFQDWKSWVWGVGIIVAAGMTGLMVHYILFRVMRHLFKTTSPDLIDSLGKLVRRPLRLILPLLIIYLSLPLLTIPSPITRIMSGILSFLLIISSAWLLTRFTAVLEELVLSQYPIEARDNLQARKISTQLRIIGKIVTVVIIILALAAVLLSFDQFRKIGTGLLASAGLAGLVIGFAAQRIFGNFLAGIQIAFTQPIRIDDVVVVENEWGKIEEITLTYVVVRIWDLRRLILPISYFIDKPFQNWTRISADLLGTVFIYVDYKVPVQEIREELRRILQNSKKWDGAVWGLQVTNATDRVVELRALMSAPDSSSAWDLRCEVREKLIGFIQQQYPDSLPKVRAAVAKTPSIEGLNQPKKETP